MVTMITVNKQSDKEKLNKFYEQIAKDSKQALIQLVSEAGHGKAFSLDTIIPTVDGWKTMKGISVGDKVFDESGNPCEVITVSPIMYNHEVYEIEFDDGRVAAINPYGPRFEGFWKMKPVDEQDDEEKHQDYLAEQEQARRPL